MEHGAVIFSHLTFLSHLLHLTPFLLIVNRFNENDRTELSESQISIFFFVLFRALPG